jgi:A/G-specific adenine glycosylase
MYSKALKNASFFQKNLMEWDRIGNKRQMPWKREKDPYKIWLSEIILQQTRVEQGTPYYLNFIKKYPNVKALSNADEKELFKLWEGLGYYNRCRNLLHTAKLISNELKGCFPTTYDSLLELKGVGPYTAAAVASFAYELPHAVVDGNVTRILSRFFGINIPIDVSDGKLFFSKLADSLLDKKNPGRYNQAIMDFGATVCKPKTPNCDVCPLSAICVAYNTNKIADFPVKAKSIQKKVRWLYFTIASYKGKYLIRRRDEKDIWRGLYEFHLTESSIEANPAKIAKQLAQKVFNHPKTSPIRLSQSFTQQLTHQTVHVSFIHLNLLKQIELKGYEWIPKKMIQELGFPRVTADYLKSSGMAN